MKDNYENVIFVEDEDFVYSMRDGVVETVLFRKKEVPEQYRNLLLAAKAMYDTSDRSTQLLERMLTHLESTIPTLKPEGQKGMRSLTGVLRTMQEEHLLAVRCAEVGFSQIGKEMVAEMLSKKRF